MLPDIAAVQAQKHVMHNAALEVLAALVQLVLESFSATTPPLAPEDGLVWALGGRGGQSLTASASAAATWTFPAAFSAVQVIGGTAVASVLSAVCLDAAPSASAASFSVRNKADARRADTCHLAARGRWL